MLRVAELKKVSLSIYYEILRPSRLDPSWNSCARGGDFSFFDGPRAVKNGAQLLDTGFALPIFDRFQLCKRAVHDLAKWKDQYRFRVHTLSGKRFP